MNRRFQPIKRINSNKHLWGIFFARRGIVSFVLCVGISFTLMNVKSSTKRYFSEFTISNFLFPAQYVANWMNSVKNLRAENKLLLQKNARLRFENDKLIQHRQENQRLRDLLEFKEEGDYPLKLASVIARDPGRLGSTCIIDVGSLDSISLNMPVITSKGAVGRVFKVYHKHSYVQFLNDPASKVSGIENSTRTLGIVESKSGQVIEYSFPVYTDVNIGDTVVTSGYGGIFPKGLRIGVIESFEKSDIDVIKVSRLKLFQDPARLEEVFVILKEESWSLRDSL